MRLLLTGVSGFIGFHLAKKLLETGNHVIGIDNLDSYYSIKLKSDRLEILSGFKQFEFHKMSLKEISGQSFKNIDVAINFAAQAGVRLPKNKHYKYQEFNIEGHKSFLDCCKKNKIENILYASSSSVYSGLSDLPFSENRRIIKTKNKYAESKLTNEKFSENFTELTNSKIIGLRFFTVYGEYGRPDMAYYSFTNEILAGREIVLFNDGETSRDMTNISDIVDGVLKSIDYLTNKNLRHEIFNLGNDSPIVTLDLVALIENEFNAIAKVKFEYSPNEVMKTHADLTKAKRLLGYSPKISIDDGLKSFFSWYKWYYKL